MSFEMDKYTTEELLSLLAERSTNADNAGDVISIIKGLAKVVGELSYCPHIPERNQGMLCAAEDTLIAASHFPHDPEFGPLTMGWNDQINGLSIRSEQDYPPANPEQVRHVEIGTGPSILTARRVG